MQETEKYRETLIQNAGKILKVLKSSGGSSTSWELKLKLHLSGSALYLALGRLEATDKITLFPGELNLTVKLNQEKKNGAA